MIASSVGPAILSRALVVVMLSISLPRHAAALTCDFFNGLTVPEPVRFEDIQEVFDRRCVSCHSANGGAPLDLTEGVSFSSLMRRPSSQDTARLLLQPYGLGPGDSLLWDKVLCDDPGVGQRMPPPGSAPLSHEDRVTLYSWIYRGATPDAPLAEGRVTVQFGLGGSWYDPTAQGQGVILEVTQADPLSPVLVAYWMTYDAVEIDANQRWMLASGFYDEGAKKVNLSVIIPTFGSFDGLGTTRTEDVGEASIVFESCTEALFSYALGFPYGSASAPLQRTIRLRRLTPNLICSEADD